VKRRTAVLLGWATAASATGLVVALSVALAAERAGERDRYGDAVVAQRRAVGKPGHRPERPVRIGERAMCVRGAGGFASAAGPALGRGARREDGSLDAAALAQVSSAAVEAGRWAEVAAAGPALPQRMGLGPDGEAVAPPLTTCDGAPALVAAQVAAPGVPVSAPPAATAPATPAKGKAKAKKPGSKAKPKTTTPPPAP